MTDRVEALRQAAQERHSATLRRAEDALQVLVASGVPVSFARLAKVAKVSRSWLYNQDELRARWNATADRTPPRPAGDHGTSRQPSSPSGSRSTPTAKRSPGCEPRTVPSTTNSPAASALNEQNTSPGRDHRRRHVHDVKTPSYLGFTGPGKENVHYGK